MRPRFLTEMEEAFAGGASRLVLITYSGLPDGLIVRSRGYRLIDVGLPCMEERSAFIGFLGDVALDVGDCACEAETRLSPPKIARLTAGMPLSVIEAVYRAACHWARPVVLENIRTAKSRDIRNLSRDLLDVSEPQKGFETVA